MVPAEALGRDPLVDGRQSEKALEIARGAIRLLQAHGFAGVSEVTLASGRRADVLALGTKGELWIIEVKSSLADFQSDQKWPEYADFCDRFYFAVAPDFPMSVLPGDVGVIVADRYGGEIVREAQETRMPAARRKAVTLTLARTAALRLTRSVDPAAVLEPVPRE